MSEGVGQEIIEFRARHDLSVKEFAKVARVSSQTVYLIEHGLSSPTNKTVAKINIAMKEYKKEV